MKTAYDYDWANQADNMGAGIDRDSDCVTADDFQMMRTREAILAKLRVIFQSTQTVGSKAITCRNTPKIKVASIGQEMSEHGCKIG